jgi:hypothetical protein
MNVWVDKADDIRFSVDDAYMTLLIAVHMSKKILEKENNISSLVKDVIKNQENEILILKK